MDEGKETLNHPQTSMKGVIDVIENYRLVRKMVEKIQVIYR